MEEVRRGRSSSSSSSSSSNSRAWKFYPSTEGGETMGSPSPNLNPKGLGLGLGLGLGREEGEVRSINPWKSSNLGAASMNAISFGFVATAILISMFLIIAILEHLFRPNNLSSSSSSSSSQDGVNGGLDSASSAKLSNQDVVMRPYASGLSVVMPGQKYPTCIAQPAPLIPFPRESVPWPTHEHHTLQFS